MREWRVRMSFKTKERVDTKVFAGECKEPYIVRKIIDYTKHIFGSPPHILDGAVSESGTDSYT
jgi:hypothetical protein